MLKQRRTVIRLVAASSRRPLRISAAVSKKFGPYCWLVDYLRGSKIEFPDIGFGILSHTFVFSIVGQQWQSYYGLVRSISYHEESSIVCANVMNGCGTACSTFWMWAIMLCPPWGSRFFKENVWDIFLLKTAALVVCCLYNVLTYCRLMQRLFKLSQQWLQSSWPLM